MGRRRRSPRPQTSRATNEIPKTGREALESSAVTALAAGLTGDNADVQRGHLALNMLAAIAPERWGKREVPAHAPAPVRCVCKIVSFPETRMGT